MSQTFNCPNCNAPLDYQGGALTVRCPYCKSSVIVPEALRSGGAEPLSFSPSGLSEEIEGMLSQIQIDKLKQVAELARSGRKIEAIKIWREMSGSSLKEAKEAVDALGRGEAVTLTGFSFQTPPAVEVSQVKVESLPPETAERVRALLRAGNKIEAINVARQAADLELQDAKALVDALDMAERMANLSRASAKAPVVVGSALAGGSCFAIGLAVFILAIVFIPLFLAFISPGGPLAEPWARINPFAKTRIELAFGGEGTGVGVFEDARHVAVDNNGHIFVGEYGGARIQVFDDTGKFITQWWGRGDNPDDAGAYISSMAVDRDGVVYVAVGGGLYRYDGLSGQLLDRIMPPSEERDYCEWVTVAPDGSLLTIWSRFGDDIVRFNRDRQVNLVIEDALGNVEKNERAERLAVDGSGNLYVLGTWSYAVFTFSSDGRYLSRFGSRGDEEGQFTSPHAIAVDNQSRVYISDFGGLLVFASDGRYLGRVPVEGFVYGMTFDDENRLYVVTSNEKVMRFSPPDFP